MLFEWLLICKVLKLTVIGLLSARIIANALIKEKHILKLERVIGGQVTTIGRSFSYIIFKLDCLNALFMALENKIVPSSSLVLNVQDSLQAQTNTANTLITFRHKLGLHTMVYDNWTHETSVNNFQIAKWALNIYNCLLWIFLIFSRLK